MAHCLGMDNAHNICPVTKSFGSWLYVGRDGHSAFALTGTTYQSVATGNTYQLETHFIGDHAVATGTTPDFWFMTRGADGNIKWGLSTKFSSYDAAADYWFKMQQGTKAQAA